MVNQNKPSLKNFKKTVVSVVIMVIVASVFCSTSKTYAFGPNVQNSKISNFYTEDNTINNQSNSSKLGTLIKTVVNFFENEILKEKQKIENDKISQLNPDETKTNCSGIEIPFKDIEFNPNINQILTLYSNGIIIGEGEKFMPNNNLRFYCMIKIAVDSYRSKIGYDLNKDLGFTYKNHFTGLSNILDPLSLKYLNTAYELGFLEDIDSDLTGYNYFNKNVTYSIVQKLFTNINKQFPLLVKNNVEFNENNTDNIITRAEYAKGIVSLFDLNSKDKLAKCLSDIISEDNTKFIDTDNSLFKDSIQTLASLGIINIQQNKKFYPDNYSRRYEFVMMLVNSILKKENQNLNIFVLDHIGTIQDIDNKASYAKYLEYAYQNGILTNFLGTENGTLKFKPNKFITKYEAYYIMSEITKKDFTSKILDSKDENITRGELSQLLVDSFDLNKDKNINNQNNNQNTESLLNNTIGFYNKAKNLLSKL